MNLAKGNIRPQAGFSPIPVLGELNIAFLRSE